MSDPAQAALLASALHDYIELLASGVPEYWRRGARAPLDGGAMAMRWRGSAVGLGFAPSPALAAKLAAGG
jgi:hypothetical protein